MIEADFLQGIIGMMIEVINVAAETNAEYIIFLLNNIFLLRFQSL